MLQHGNIKGPSPDPFSMITVDLTIASCIHCLISRLSERSTTMEKITETGGKLKSLGEMTHRHGNVCSHFPCLDTLTYDYYLLLIKMSTVYYANERSSYENLREKNFLIR